MKKSAMVDVIQKFVHAYPNTKLFGGDNAVEGMVRVWWEVLGDLEDAHVDAAATRWMMTEQWFPAPSQIRKSAIQIQMRLPEPNAACTAAFAAARSADPAVWKGTHPVVIEALKDVGGARAVNDTQDISRLRDAYLKAYDRRVNDVFVMSIPNRPEHSALNGKAYAELGSEI